MEKEDIRNIEDAPKETSKRDSSGGMKVRTGIKAKALLSSNVVTNGNGNNVGP